MTTTANDAYFFRGKSLDIDTPSDMEAWVWSTADGKYMLLVVATLPIAEANITFSTTTGHAHTGADSHTISHTNLTDKGTNAHSAIDTFISNHPGTNSHAQIDTFIGTKAQAGGLASLDGSSLVVQNPANATATPAANKILIASATGEVTAWVSDADANTKGKIQLAGQLGGTAASPTVVGIYPGTALTFGTISDGQFWKRVGNQMVGASAASGSADTDEIENNLIMLAWDVLSTDHVYDDIYLNDFEADEGVDPASTYTYDAGNDWVGQVTGAAGQTVDADFVDAGDFSQRSLADIDWVQDSGTAGHLSAAAADVIPGVLITFADASTATVVSKSGDGTSASSVVLSVAHASDSSLTSITGIIVSGVNITVNSYSHLDPDGANNPSTTDKLPTFSGYTNGNWTISSDNNTWPSWQAANDVLTGSSGWQGDDQSYWQVDAGEGNAWVCNKFRFYNYDGSTPQPKRFKFQGSNNGSDWTDLHTTYASADCPQYAAHVWCPNEGGGYFTFSNSTAYRYYRLQVISTYTSYCTILEIELIEALPTVAIPTALYAAITTDGHTRTNTTTWTDLNSVACTQNASGYKYVAVRFDAATTWYAYVAGQLAIVQFIGGTTWQYKDAAGDFQNSTVNTELGALAQALDIAQNQMTATQFAALSEANLDTLGWSVAVDSMDIAVGLKADGANLPTVDKFTWNFDQSGQDMVLVMDSWEASANDPTDAYTVLQLEPQEAYTLNTDLKAYVSMDDGSNYEQFTLNPFREVGTSDFVRGDISGLTARTDKTMRLKVTTHNTKNVKVSALSLGVKYT